MVPDNPELLINEGDELVINCTSRSAFKIIFPWTNSYSFINTSEHGILYEKDEYTGIVEQIFQRKTTVHGDTGWYGCVDERIKEIDKGNFVDPHASWIYVYVKSNKHLFASDDEDVQLIFSMAGDMIILPCRPTSPELHVTLTPQPVKLNDKVSFDPKIDFSMKNMSAIDSRFYTCTIAEGDEETELVFSVTIQKPIDKLIPPVISAVTLDSVTKGTEMNVICTAEVGTEPYMISLTTPRENAVHKVYILPTQIIDEGKRLATLVLNIQNATYDDEGEYVCELEVHKDSMQTKTYITINDPNDRHINLTSSEPYRFFKIYEGNPVTFMANIEGHPPPTIIWMKGNPRGHEMQGIITSGPGIVVNITGSSASLRIEKTVPMNAGVYTLQAYHEDNPSVIESLNFTLEVLAKPTVFLNDDDLRAFFSVNETANFTCTAYNNPPANISIVYYKCPHYPVVLEDCEAVQIDSTIVRNEITEQVVRAQFQVDKIGFVRCTACNELGCDLIEVPLQLTDGVPNQLIGIVSDPETVNANDNVKLTCMAPIYNASKI